MTDQTKKTTKENNTQLDDKQLDEASGGIPSFSELQGITTEVDVIEGTSAPAGAFRGVDGMDSKTETIEYQDGDDTILRNSPKHD